MLAGVLADRDLLLQIRTVRVENDARVSVVARSLANDVDRLDPSREHAEPIDVLHFATRLAFAIVSATSREAVVVWRQWRGWLAVHVSGHGAVDEVQARLRAVLHQVLGRDDSVDTFPDALARSVAAPRFATVSV